MPKRILQTYRDTICALASPSGLGGVALIRVSGPDALAVCKPYLVFKGKKTDFFEQASHTLRFADFVAEGELIDEVVVSLFRNPSSYTGEDVVEISCHASTYILQRIIQCLIVSGARQAKAGEFTMRAFLNGKIDLAQAEAVADLLAAENKAAHRLAMQQLRGGYSSEIANLREKLLEFAALLELELDFSEEDVEFADRKQLMNLLSHLKKEIFRLKNSFVLGNVIKNGIATAIVGKPNVGKSTLLNCLLNEEKAIVSDIAGTTRDAIEDVVNIDGMRFRFIDTAGLRITDNPVEKIGIEKTRQKMTQAQLVLYLFDAKTQTVEEADKEASELWQSITGREKALSSEENSIFPALILVGNKAEDILQNAINSIKNQSAFPLVWISAKQNINMDSLLSLLKEIAAKFDAKDQSLVSNVRHFEALSKGFDDIQKVEDGIQTGLPSDLVAIEVRSALRHLGEITGEINTEDILGGIFGRFCIGK